MNDTTSPETAYPRADAELLATLEPQLGMLLYDLEPDDWGHIGGIMTSNHGVELVKNDKGNILVLKTLHDRIGNGLNATATELAIAELTALDGLRATGLVPQLVINKLLKTASGEPLVATHFEHRFIPYATVSSERLAAELLDPDGGNENYFALLLQGLRQIHDHGFIHGDAHTRNVGKIGDDEIMFLDWEFSGDLRDIQYDRPSLFKKYDFERNEDIRLAIQAELIKMKNSLEALGQHHEKVEKWFGADFKGQERNMETLLRRHYFGIPDGDVVDGASQNRIIEIRDSIDCFAVVH